MPKERNGVPPLRENWSDSGESLSEEISDAGHSRWLIGLALCLLVSAGATAGYVVGVLNVQRAGVQAPTPAPSSDAPGVSHLRPAAEFAPTEAVVVSEYLFSERNPGVALARAVHAAGAQVLVLTNTALSETEQEAFLREHNIAPGSLDVSFLVVTHETFWLRDFGPIPVFSRPHFGAADRSLRLVDFVYRDRGYLDDTVPYQMALLYDLSIEHAPVQFDGGNFLTDGRRCFMTDDIYYQDDAALEPAATQIIDRMIEAATGCRELVVFRAPPHEHIDMWMKITSPTTALVNAIDQPTIAWVATHRPELEESVLDVKRALDRLAKSASQHLNVARLPMPLPQEELFRTYANAVLVNGQAIVPRYRHDERTGGPYEDLSLLLEQEKVARRVYEEQGFHVVFVDADHLIVDGGALHCVTTHLPTGDSKPALRVLREYESEGEDPLTDAG